MSAETDVAAVRMMIAAKKAGYSSAQVKRGKNYMRHIVVVSGIKTPDDKKHLEWCAKYIAEKLNRSKERISVQSSEPAVGYMQFRFSDE